MSWGPFIALLLKALPDILFLWRRRVERGDREAIHEDVQEFRAALFDASRTGDSPVPQAADSASPGGGNLDRAAELLERRVREARQLRQQRSPIGAA
jgi:hypothetical protein